MGNYPYRSSYILNGNGELPAYPVRVACEALAEEGLEGTPLLSAFADSLGVFYNYSGVQPAQPCSILPMCPLFCTQRKHSMVLGCAGRSAFCCWLACANAVAGMPGALRGQALAS